MSEGKVSSWNEQRHFQRLTVMPRRSAIVSILRSLSFCMSIGEIIQLEFFEDVLVLLLDECHGIPF